VAQGIIAQARVLGGSFGIAASTVVRGITERKELAGIVPISQMSSLNISTLDHIQILAVQKAYSDSFSKILWISAIISGISILFSLGSFTRNPVTLAEKTQLQIVAEKERLRLRAENVRNDSLHDGESEVMSGEQVMESTKRNEV